MIIWGGAGLVERDDGGCYNLVADRWMPVSTNGAPSARAAHTAVWTGSQMVVWGGGDSVPYGDGARYDRRETVGTR